MWRLINTLTNSRDKNLSHLNKQLTQYIPKTQKGQKKVNSFNDYFVAVAKCIANSITLFVL